MGFLKIKNVVRPEDGFELECLDKKDAVAIVLFNSDYSKVLLVKQFRAGAESSIYELPAGIVEDEDYLNAALRELREETGYIETDVDDINLIGDYYASPGYTSEKIVLYSMRLLPSAKQLDLKLDDEEIIEDIKWFNVESISSVSNCMKTVFGVTAALSRPKKKIGIYGGSFNPITNLHLLTVERAIEELGLDKCIIEPVNDSYYKRELINYEHRKNIVSLAIEGNDKLELGTYEGMQLVQPNTIETLSYYKKLYGWCEIYFICGSDNLKQIYTWANYGNIIRDFKVICIQRDNDNVYQDIILRDKYLIKHKKNITVIHENVVNNISSSSIRNLVKAGMSIKYLLPENVRQYIYNNNLYISEE